MSNHLCLCIIKHMRGQTVLLSFYSTSKETSTLLLFVSGFFLTPTLHYVVSLPQPSKVYVLVSVSISVVGPDVDSNHK